MTETMLSVLENSCEKKNGFIPKQDTIPKTFEVHGIKYMEAQTSLNRIKNLVANFKVRPTDVFLAGYPKTGNHWLKFIVAMLSSNGNACLSTHIDEQISWLEFGSARVVDGHYETEYETFDRLDNLPFSKPRFFNTHLHWELLPKEVTEGKIILVVRNPRDVAVSFYHFMVAQHVYFNYQETFQQFIDRFTANGGPPFGCGSYFSFYSNYWEHFNDMPILLVHYEDMKHNLAKEIKRISQFLEINLADEVVRDIAHKCTFDNMRNHLCISALDACLDTSKSRFLRKGETGDWERHMSPKQVAHFEDIEEQWYKSTTFRPKMGYRD